MYLEDKDATMKIVFLHNTGSCIFLLWSPYV